MSCGCLTTSDFFGCNASLISPTHKTSETLETCPKKSFHSQDKKIRLGPLAHLYRFQGDNFEQRLWDKGRCYWELTANLKNALEPCISRIFLVLTLFVIIFDLG